MSPLELTVEEILALDSLKDLKLVAGKNGMKRQVSNINVMEVPDFESWVSEGQLLLTTAYSIKDDKEALDSLIPKLAEKKLAGLVVKVPRFLSELPDTMVTAANRYDFPLIEMPAHLSHPFVINEIHQAFTKKQNELLLISERQHQIMMNLLIQGGSFKEVCNMLQDSFKHSVLIVGDNCRDILEYSLSPQDAGASPQELTDYLNENGIFKRVLSSKQSLIHKYASPGQYLVVVPIQTGGLNNGFLITKCNDGLPSEQYLKSLEHATMTIALIFYNQRNLKDVETRYCSEFLSDWFSGKILSDGTLRQRLEAIGWNIRSDVGLLILADPSADLLFHTSEKDLSKAYLHTENIKRAVKNSIEKMCPAHYTGNVGSNMVLIVQLPQSTAPSKATKMLKQIAGQLIQDIDALYPSQLCAFSGIYRRNLLDIKETYEEAKIALKIKKTYLHDKRVLFFEDLGIFSLINSISKSEAERLTQRYFTPLQKHDSDYNTQYVLTARSYFECECNMRKLASKLFIHYNTACYRMQAISELLAVNLNSSADRALLYLSVLIGCSARDEA